MNSEFVLVIPQVTGRSSHVHNVRTHKMTD